MRYFKEVSIWKIIILNAIVGFCLSTPLFIGIVYLFGFWGRTPPIKEKLTGILIFIGILIVVILSNFILWKLNKKINKEKTEIISLKSTLTRIVLTIIIFIIMIGAFFTLPHIWIMFNGGWF